VDEASLVHRGRIALELGGLQSSINLVKGRVDHFEGFDLRCSINHFRQQLGDFCVGPVVVNVGAFLVVPQTDRERFPAGSRDKTDLILEAFLLAQQRKVFLLQLVGEFGLVIGLKIY